MPSFRMLDRLTTSVIMVTVVLVPLAMPVFHGELTYAFGEFKVFTLHLAAVLITAGLTAEAILRQPDLQLPKFNLSTIRQSPITLAVTGLILLLVAQILSLVMSPLPKVSFFGLYEEFNGFNVYDWISMSVVLLGVSLKVRTLERLKLLINILVIGGALTAAYGLLQHFGWDGLGGRQSALRILSTFGNTLNLGGFLVITIPLTISLFVSDQWRKPSLVSVAILLLGLQFSAVWFTEGRAAYVATFVGSATFSIFLARAEGFKPLLRTVGLIAISGVIAVVIIIAPSPNQGNGVARLNSIDDEIGQILTQGTSSSSALFSGRLELWKTSLSLILDPEVPQRESGLTTRLRTIFGYGPEMFVHSYVLRMEPRTQIRNQVNAHNVFLHVLVTAGLLGFASLTFVIVGFLWIGFRVFSLITKSVESSDNHLLVLSVLLAVLAGKSLEMAAGVPRVSDLVPLVAIIGAIIAAYSIFEGGYRDSIPQIDKKRRGKRYRESGGNRIAIGFGIFSVIALATLFIAWDIPRMNSTMIGASAKSAGSPAQAGQKFVEANLSEPQRVFYVTELTPAYLEFSAAAYAEGRLDVAERTLLTLKSLWLAIEERDPYDYAANVMLSKISSIMVQRGNLEYTQELIDDHSKVVSYFPQYPELVGTAATVAATAGDYELAILFAEKAIAHEPSTRELSRTWYAKGISLFILGFEKQGISDLLNATKKLPDSDAATLAHMALAKIYGDRGDNAKADFHLAEASH